MDERQKVERLAREVMGWEVDEYGYEDRTNGVQYLLSQEDPGYFPWNPYSDPAADYEVLCRVREDFELDERDLFGLKVREIWQRRDPRLLDLLMYYEPGDYARAVDAVLDAPARRCCCKAHDPRDCYRLRYGKDSVFEEECE